MSSEIWVFSEQPALLAELISAGSEFGEVTALVSGARSLAEQTASQGAHKIYWLGEISSKDMVEDLVPTITRLAKEEQPSLIISRFDTPWKSCSRPAGSLPGNRCPHRRN